MAMKKLSAALLALMLTVPCTVPAVCLADSVIPAETDEGGRDDAAAVSDDAAESDQESADSQEEESQGLKLTTKTYKKEFKTAQGTVYKEISYEYPVAEGNSEAAQAFNKFYKNLRTKWLKAAKENLEDAKELVADREDDIHYGDSVTCEITNNDENYISVLQSGYVYEMGAHGMPYRYTYIFDTKTGKKVSAANLLGFTKKNLNKKIRNLYLKKFDKAEAEEDQIFYPNKDEVEKALSEVDFNKNLYYLKNGKIRFYVNPYVVAPYAGGFIEVAVKL